jgi:hypothetical protein
VEENFLEGEKRIYLYYDICASSLFANFSYFLCEEVTPTYGYSRTCLAPSIFRNPLISTTLLWNAISFRLSWTFFYIFDFLCFGRGRIGPFTHSLTRMYNLGTRSDLVGEDVIWGPFSL